MPCPSGVAIPLCFEEYNQMHMFGDPEAVKFRYALRASGELSDGKPGFASQCAGCLACLEKCPQHIPIPDFLRQIAAEMEGPGLDDRLAKIRQLFKVEPK